MNSQFNKYIDSFKKLRRAPQYGGAPHKPILLLSILEGVRRGEITSNKIYITPELVLCFKEFWSKIVTTPHQANFALPFYHMQSEAFWKLICKPGHEIVLTASKSIKSLTSLDNSILYAEIDFELFILMCNEVNNNILKETIFSYYFTEIKSFSVNYEFINNIEKQILNDNQEDYINTIEKISKSDTPEEIEEELFIRGNIFKREIPKIYNYTCAISRMKITSTSNAQMVDACHIIPFSLSKNDTIKNGISLCPNLHRAFDRGLISISTDYKVIVSNQVKEDNSPFSLLQFKNKDILLPTNNKFYPDKENLNWHQKNTFIN